MPRSLVPFRSKAWLSSSPERRTTSIGVGIADWPCAGPLWPISFAYSGSTGAAPPTLPAVARCQTRTNAANRSSESTHGRSNRPFTGSGFGHLALEVLLGAVRIELLAEDGFLAESGGRRLRPEVGHQAFGVRGQHHLLGELLEVDVLLEHVPAAQLG